MHPRTLAATTAVAAVSALTLVGCGGSKAAAGSGATSGTSQTTSASSISGPTATPSTPSTVSIPSTTSAPSATSTSSPPQTPQTPQTPPTTPAPAPCTGLDARMVALPGVASGSTFADLIVVNHGTATCTLPAQPKPEYLTAAHKALPIQFSTDPDLKPYPLAPGASAVTVVAYSSAAQQPCGGRIAYVRISSVAGDIPFNGRDNCSQDSTYDEGWIAGTYAAPH